MAVPGDQTGALAGVGGGQALAHQRVEQGQRIDPPVLEIAGEGDGVIQNQARHGKHQRGQDGLLLARETGPATYVTERLRTERKLRNAMGRFDRLQSQVERLEARVRSYEVGEAAPSPWEAEAAGATVVATGRSDFPNQVNNSLCFPGIFRGVLDVRARTITDDMCFAAADALGAPALTAGRSGLPACDHEDVQSLRELVLSNNKLGGAIPESIERLASLKVLQMQHNDFDKYKNLGELNTRQHLVFD